MQHNAHWGSTCHVTCFRRFVRQTQNHKNRLCEKFLDKIANITNDWPILRQKLSQQTVQYVVHCVKYTVYRTLYVVHCGTRSTIPSPTSPSVLCVFQALETENQPPRSQSQESLRASLQCHMLESHRDRVLSSRQLSTSQQTVRVLRSWGLYVPLCTAAGGGR